MIFGLRLKLSSFNESSKDDDSIHKVIIFAKDDEGCILLNKIYSKIFCDFDGIGNYDVIKEYWNEKHLKLCIPFYDSFLFYNTLIFANCIPDFSFTTPTFFMENNNLPFDNLVSSKVDDYCSSNDLKIERVKSIYYKYRTDIEAYQTYKCICNRRMGRSRSLSNPGLDQLGSREFCIESWKESA